MKWMKKALLAVCLAALLGIPFLSYADEPQAPVPEQQQTIIAPADQGADQQTPPDVPAPQEEGQKTEAGK